VLTTYCPPLATNKDGEVDAACALKSALAEPLFVTTNRSRDRVGQREDDQL
jgi:hypothetical protein